MGDRTIGDVLTAARDDIAVFARDLLGAPLWDHQLEVVRSPARYRVICAGRQVGKSRLLAVLALHAAFTRAGATVLLVSAGDAASKRLLSEITGLVTGAPLLAGSVVDESSKVVTLTNGSTIRAVPASMSQIRGYSVDVLVVDEAAFIDPEIWYAAQPTIIARPGSRVVLTSTPWNKPDHFFRVLWDRGMAEPDATYESWHWPSIVSPLVTEAEVEEKREQLPPGKFAAEYLAEWTDAAGAYFTSVELDDAVVDDAWLDEADEAWASVGAVVGGVDFGMQRDAHTLVLIGQLPELDGRGRPRYVVRFVEERFGLSYEGWLDRLLELGRALPISWLTAEMNGVGQMAAAVLARRVDQELGGVTVDGFTTTARTKENQFGFARLLMQQGRLLLPRHPALLRQLSALEFSMLDSGGLRISVPERAGHDDCAMALALALEPLMAHEAGAFDHPPRIVQDEDMWPEDYADGVDLLAHYGDDDGWGSW